MKFYSRPEALSIAVNLGAAQTFLALLKSRDIGVPERALKAPDLPTRIYETFNLFSPTDIELAIAEAVAATSTTVTLQNVLEAAPATATSTVTASQATVATSSTITVTLQEKDAEGNDLTTGGSTVVFSTQAGTGTATVGATTDNTDGTYTATVTGATAGTVTLKATLNGVLVTDTAAITVTT